MGVPYAMIGLLSNNGDPIYRTHCWEAAPRSSPALLEAEWRQDQMPIPRAMRAGKSEEVLLCVAGMVLELWEFADQLRQSPETSAGALRHANGWASPAAAKILQKLTLGAAVAAVPEGGLMRGFRPPAAHSGRRPAAQRAATGGHG